MEIGSVTPLWLTACVFAFGLSFAAGCAEEEEDENSCNCPGDIEWFCQPLDSVGNPKEPNEGCAETVGDAKTACAAWTGLVGGVSYEFFSAPCESLIPGETGDACDGWDPGFNVTYNSGVYEIDKDFATDVLADPSQLVHCDDTEIVIYPSSPAYGVDNISSGDLADELGLNDGDEFVQLNGIDIDTKADLVSAVLQLRGNGETEFTLLINRGAGQLTLYYELVP